MNKKLMIEFKTAYHFLSNHPAFAERFNTFLDVIINHVCKNGVDEDFKNFHYISAPYNKKNKARIKEFDEAWDKCPQYREFEDDYLNLLYKHPHKQHSFLRNSPLNNQGSKRGLLIMEEVFNGKLEAKKQSAVYVGLTRYKNKIDTKGKIKHPFQISRKTAQDQLTKINDYILITSIGVKYGQY
jgi:hypothetical protein